MTDDHAAASDTLLEDAVRNVGIPPRPAVLDRVQLEMSKEEPDLSRLAAIISSDVSLAAGLMKIANSPYFGLRGRTRTVHQAVVLLGPDFAARAITGMVLRNAFPRAASLERFWDASARIAQICGWLAAREPLREMFDVGDAYTYGLFRDCGIPIMLRKYADYAETLAIANDESTAGFTEVELARHPTNHAVVGCVLARTWWLPENSCIAIRHHHDVPAIAAGSIALPTASARLISLAQFAERIFQLSTGLSHTREWEKMGSLCLSLLGLGEREEQTLSNAAAELAIEAN
jgi:HD-like signal output (HDOD) protein